MTKTLRSMVAVMIFLSASFIAWLINGSRPGIPVTDFSAVALKNSGGNNLSKTGLDLLDQALAGLFTDNPLRAARTAAGLLWKPDPGTLVPEQIQQNQADLAAFTDLVADGDGNGLKGVFVPDVLSLPVVQQPGGQAAFVSGEDNILTQFAMPGDYGTVGLLAHNYLSGRDFFNLQVGQGVALVYGDRQVDYYVIREIRQFQALDPTNPYSEFINLDDPNQQRVSAADLFKQIYTTADRAVFQTCLEAFGNSSWGRVFVIAEKVGSTS